MKFEDLTGMRFHRLTALRRASEIGEKTKWYCKCDCGNTVTVASSSLKSGHTKSCGCYSKDISPYKHRTHGKTKSRLYVIWTNMKERTTNIKNPSYSSYGSRGIKVCMEWLNDFEAFDKWAMSAGYADTLTLERIDVNGDYCPENCKWIPRSEQNYNKRNSRFVEAFGEKKTIAEWSKELGINQETLRDRIDRGWPPEYALTMANVPHGYTWKSVVVA